MNHRVYIAIVRTMSMRSLIRNMVLKLRVPVAYHSCNYEETSDRLEEIVEKESEFHCLIVYLLESISAYSFHSSHECHFTHSNFGFTEFNSGISSWDKSGFFISSILFSFIHNQSHAVQTLIQNFESVTIIGDSIWLYSQ